MNTEKLLASLQFHLETGVFKDVPMLSPAQERIEFEMIQIARLRGSYTSQQIAWKLKISRRTVLRRISKIKTDSIDAVWLPGYLEALLP